MIINYLVFGNQLLNYTQAAFSMLSFLSQKEETDTIAVVTDHPEKFNMLKDKINVLAIDDQTLQEWRGEHDFFWRIKIKALEFVSEKFKNQDVLYLDGDTFLFGSLKRIKDELSKGNNLMHIKEYKLSESKYKTNRLMWRQIKNKKYLGIEITKDSYMWNAGAIGIPKENLQSIDTSLRICDQMCAEGVTRRLIEQFAFSLALNQPSKLVALENEIGHYWGNKERWTCIINDFFNNCLMECIPLERQITKVAEFDFYETPVIVDIPNTRKRLHKKIKRYFPDRDHVYVPKE